MKTRLYIATSEGPSEVQSLIEEDSDIACAVCLNGSIKALPITRDYNAFVRKPTGVIEKMTGHKSYRVDVSHPITNGESWQLGLYLAHALAMKNELAREGEVAERVWLITGAVSARDELVQSVSHIQQKLDLAKDMLRQMEGATEISFIIPAVDRDQLENDHGFNIIPVATANEVLQGKIGNASKNKTAKKMVLWSVAATFLVAAGVLGQNSGFLDGMLNVKSAPKPTMITSDETPLVTEIIIADPIDASSNEILLKENTAEVQLTEISTVELTKKERVEEAPIADLLENITLRVRKISPADGQSCAGRKFRGSKLQAAKIKAPWDVGLIDAPSICGLRVSLKNKGLETIRLNLTILAAQGDLLRGRDPEISLNEIEIPAGQSHRQDVNFSLYRSGNYQLNLSYGITGSDLVERNLQLIAADDIENTDTKYQ